jgi:predicted anti-sigma-YlaC factor YlaD
MAGELLDLQRGCARAREWVSLRIDAELSELERLLLRRHLSRCESCRELAEAVAVATEIVRTTPHELPSRALEPAQPRIAQRRRVLHRLAAAAAVVAVGAGLGTLVATQGDGPGPAQPRSVTDIALVTPPPARPIVEPPGKNV